MQKTRPVTKPSKQRKMLFQAPNHLRQKRFAASLSSELKASHGVGAVPVRSGDTVHIMRGDHKGFEGKVSRVDRKKYRIYVEGLTRETVEGTTTFVPVHPSKVMITRLDLDDKWRKKILERKKTHRRTEVAAEKLPKKAPEAEVTQEETAEEEETSKPKTKTKEKETAEKPVGKKKGEHKTGRKMRKTAKMIVPKAKKEEKTRKTKSGRRPSRKLKGEQ